jgi:hypothetical protein
MLLLRTRWHRTVLTGRADMVDTDLGRIYLFIYFLDGTGLTLVEFIYLLLFLDLPTLLLSY